MTETRLSIGAAGGCAAALGWFDGLHTGHIALIRATVETAAKNGLSAAVWTFEGSKNAGSGFSPGFILSDAEKADILRKEGISVLFSERFSDVRDLTCEEFVDRVLIGRCRCEIALCGFNYRFGRGGAGDAGELVRLMESRGKRAVVMPPVTADGATVSSSAIRSLLAEGDAAAAAKLLGRPFSLTSQIVHGRRIGHRLGFPTLNQSFPEGGFVPRYGVYAADVAVGGRVYRAVSNVGVRPTFGGGPAVCESHLLAGDPGECYGMTAVTRFLSFIREETAFGSEKLLKDQIVLDVAAAEEYFGAERN